MVKVWSKKANPGYWQRFNAAYKIRTYVMCLHLSEVDKQLRTEARNHMIRWLAHAHYYFGVKTEPIDIRNLEASLEME